MNARILGLTALLVAGVTGLSVLPVRAEDTPLQQQMEVLNDSYKRLGKTTEAAAGVKEARAAQAAAHKAAALVPEAVDGMPAGAPKDKALATYKTMIGQLYVLFCRVELAFLDGKAEEVTKLLGEMKALKKEGHGQFIEDEE